MHAALARAKPVLKPATCHQTGAPVTNLITTLQVV